MSRRSRLLRRKIISIFFLIVGLLILGVVALIIGYLLPFFFQYSKPGIHIAKSTPDHRVTVLLLGIGGGNHDGPLLTDTMQFASIDPTHNKIDLVSIPRDLWNPIINQKINATYALAEQNQPGSGLAAAKKIVSQILGQPVDYGFRIDFQGFVKAIDEVGGLDVHVQRTLDDYEYPISGKEDDTCGFTQQQIVDLSAQIATGSATNRQAFPCRYMHLHIPAGLQHMDGTTALEFARSRHAMGVEGTDFARSARQQLIIEAFRAKLFSTGTLLNPGKIISLFNILKSSIDTDIPESQFADFIKLAQKMKGAKIHSYVLDYTDDPTDQGNLLIQGNPNDFGGAYALEPRDGFGNYTQIQAFVACKVQNINCPTPTPNPTLIQAKTASHSAVSK